MEEKSFSNSALPENFDLVCFSHLRWDFVYQRPQHLLSRFAKERRVYYIEEPIFSDDANARLEISRREDNLSLVVPHFPHEIAELKKTDEVLREMLVHLFEDEKIGDFVLWYYTPMARAFSSHLQPLATVYDCMDELSAFKFAPPSLHENEAELFARADLVFTGGQSLYEAKKNQHHSVYAFPSSIDVAHFAKARNITEEPADQSAIPHPRLGFCGVIDERMDIDLLAKIAQLRPDYQWIMIGPVVKINEADLPRHANIHYLGSKSYQDLPHYIAGWDAALLTFALNESTKFISPTKTPEYLAAGKPVVSTPIRDVVRPYGELGLVEIATTAEEFVAAAENAMREDSPERLAEADKFLAQISWDKTWSEMNRLIIEAVEKKSQTALPNALTSSAAAI